MAAKSSKKSGTKKNTTAQKKRTVKKNTAGKNTARKGAKQNTGSRSGNSGDVSGISVTMKKEIIFLAVIVFSILSFLSCFHMCGILGEFLSAFIFGMLGALAYVFPFYLVIATGFFISNPERPYIRRKVILSAFVLWCLCALFQWVVNDPVNKIWELYLVCAQNHGGGGLLGGIVSVTMEKLLGRGGSLIVILALFLLFSMLITGKLFFSALYNLYRENEKEDGYVEYEEYEDGYDEDGYDRGTSVSSYSGGKRRPMAMVTLERDGRNEQAPKKTRKKTKTMKDEEPELLRDAGTLQEKSQEDGREKQKDDLSDIHIIGAYDPPSEAKIPIYKEELKEKFESEKAGGDSGIEQNIQTAGASSGTESKKEKVKITKEDEKEMEKVRQDLERAAISEVPYEYPPLDLLSRPKAQNKGMTHDDLRETAHKLQETLESFGVHVKMGDISLGPSVTRYELIPEQGVKVSRITGLSDDIKLSLAASDIRIEAPIPGKSAVGIEVPNAHRSMVTLRELLESSEFQKAKSKVTFAVGKDISGKTIVTDIAKMPHLLIAGATGSGKSVLINTLIMSILYKANPNEVKLIMVDPKMVELTAYENIPHLMIPVVNDPKKASAALAWAVAEMTNRYQKFADASVRDIASYNARLDKITNKDDPEYQKLPQIVIVVDEFADLMMVAPGEVEDAVCRLAQLARAAGIHLVLATQRPSVNVITGLIKANIPSRIALSVSSQVDSRTIIDSAGADKLLGNGDMLFAPQNLPKPIRVQGAFVSDEERDGVVGFLKNHSDGPSYNEEVTRHIDTTPVGGPGNSSDLPGDGIEQDELFVQAGMFIIEKDKASIGLLQRMFRIGFNRAARIMDQLADAGVVGSEEGTKARQILMSKEQFENYLEENG